MLAPLLLFVLFAIGTSFVCSIMEATVLSIPVSNLAELATKGRKGAGFLLDLKKNRLDDLISAILTLNTMANTLGASMAGAEAAVIWGNNYLGLFSGILTFLILVFAEIIPKTLGSMYAGRIAPWIGYLAIGLVRAMQPVLFITRALTRLLAPEPRKSVTSGELSAMIALAAQEGTLADYQSEAFANLLELERMKIEDVMTPRTVLQMLPAKTTLQNFIDMKLLDPFSRIPLYGESRDDVSGYLLVREVLLGALRGKSMDTPLSTFQRPISFLPRACSVGNALRHLSKRRDQIAMVVDEFGGVSGLISLEDLFETILGMEIIDESDRVADLQVIAKQLRDKRLSRLKAVGSGSDATN
ncbi:MAG: HlyC/CorC family transporter [Acidobacteria bacterium]|nr:HlyC/CorC family transporter [Acidobacteriota bacterium]MCB9398579.1 HlyC/CorC family transporter [Acidobacteriota bacterium]